MRHYADLIDWRKGGVRHSLASRAGRPYTTRMGWRVWDAYERDAKEHWRALPWRERYNWRGVAALALIVGLALVYLLYKHSALIRDWRLDSGEENT